MTNSIPLYLTLSPSVIFQQIDDEAVLLDMGSEQYYALNALGTRIWQHLSVNSDTNHLLEQLLIEYDVNESLLRRDVSDWIDKLLALELVKIDVDTP